MEKTFRRILCVIFAVLLALCVTGCEYTGDDDVEPAKTTTTHSDTKPTVQGPSPSVVLAEQEIYNDNGLIVKTLGIGEDEYSCSTIELEIVNQNAYPLDLKVESLAINSIMLDCYWRLSIAASETTQTEIVLYKEVEDLFDIEAIKEVEVVFTASNSTNATEFTTGTIMFSTTGSDAYVQSYNVSDKILYNVNGVKVYLLGALPGTDYHITKTYFYIDNSSDTNIRITVDCDRVNDVPYVVDGSYGFIKAGYKGYTYIQLNQNDLTQEGVTEALTNMTVSITVWNAENGAQIDNAVHSITF